MKRTILPAAACFILLAGFASAQLYPAGLNPAQFAPVYAKGAKVFVVDSVNGSATANCLTFATPCLTLAQAYAKTTSGRNDTILIVGNATPLTPTATLAWSNSYTHLIGLSAPVPGVGQRAMIQATTANDMLQLITLSGAGCIFKNLKIVNESDNAANAGAMVVSGERNYFENVFFAGMANATALGPATRAGGFSLAVSGAENTFKDCYIGLDTIVRSAANSELIVSAERNRFVHCDIRSNSVTAGKFLVSIDSTADLRDILFDGCLFMNYTTNWATGITDAFHFTGAGNTHYVILKECALVGVGTGWGDVVTHIYTADPQPNAGAGIATNPTT